LLHFFFLVLLVMGIYEILGSLVAQLVKQRFRKPKSESDEKSSTNQSLDDKKDKNNI